MYFMRFIYNSRNYSILLNCVNEHTCSKSTTVEIILYYLTCDVTDDFEPSTTVEIILYYLTENAKGARTLSTTVEIILYYLTSEGIVNRF